MNAVIWRENYLNHQINVVVFGIINPSKIPDCQYGNSQLLTQEGSQLIKNQDLIYDIDQSKLKEIKNGIKCEKSKQYQDILTKIKQTLENCRPRFKLLESSIEPTAYSWLTTIPLMEHDFDNVLRQHWHSL